MEKEKILGFILIFVVVLSVQTVWSKKPIAVNSMQPTWSKKSLNESNYSGCVSEPEICDGIDNDCDGSIDENPITNVCNKDSDCGGYSCKDGVASEPICIKPGTCQAKCGYNIFFNTTCDNGLDYTVYDGGIFGESAQTNYRGIKISCKDSDGGKNYYVKGYVEGYYWFGMYYKKYDECITKGMYKGYLREYYCSKNTPKSIIRKCQYGCKNGACVKPDPCANVTCPDKCEDNTRLYNGYCSKGSCVYSLENCVYGCVNGVCIECECGVWADDVCGGGNCLAEQMRQTKACSPAGCDVEEQCVDDPACVVGVSAFVVENDLGERVASFSNTGNLILKGSCTAGGDCSYPGDDAFIIQDASSETVAYINSIGNLCVEDTDCNDYDANCDNPGDGSFIVKDSNDVVVSYISATGDLCLIGQLVEDGNP